MLWTLPLLPAVAALALVLPPGRRAPGPVAFASVLVLLALSGWALATGPEAGWRWGAGLELRLAADGLARLMAVLVPLVAAPVVAYAAAGEARGRVRLLALLLAFTGAMELLVLAADLLTLLVGFELVGALSWGLIAHDWRDPSRPRCARHALLTTRFGDLGLYVAAGAAFAATGSFSYAGLAGLRGPHLEAVAAGLFLAAAAKSAQLPFAPWLFAAMAGPTPVSALLHSATMVAAGAYVLARLVPLLHAVPWLPAAVAGLGLATALAGGTVATLQRDLKKALAASTSAQYGLVLVAVGAGSTAAAGAHLVAHAVFKALLFLGAGVALHAAGTGELGRLRLGSALPRTAAFFAMGALALAAVPPLGAAFTKERVLSAAAHASLWLGAGVLVAGFLSALYAGRLQLLAFGPGGAREGRRPSGGQEAAMAGLALLSVLLGVLWLPGASPVIERVTEGELLAGSAPELALSLAVVAAAFGVVWVLGRRGELLTLGVPRGLQAAAASWWGIPALARRAVAVPVEALAVRLARLDDSVVDAGVRAAGRTGELLSRLMSWWSEGGLEAALRGTASATLFAAGLSRSADERGVDAAVEEVARGVGVSGRRSVRLQTGLAHHYYVILAAGALLVIAVAALRG